MRRDFVNMNATDKPRFEHDINIEPDLESTNIGNFVEVPFVDFSAQYTEERDAIHGCVDAVFSEGQFVSEKKVAEFESLIAETVGTSFAIGVSSGTDALYLGLRALEVGPGDEVITPPNSHFSSTSAIVQAGATPVFVDVLDDQNIDPDAIKAAINKRTKVIMPVHLTGRVARMDEILGIAQTQDITILEDAAQAFGARYSDQCAGSFGRVAAFSAHPLKVFNAAGDAGFLTTDDEELAHRLRRLRNNGLHERETLMEWGVVSRLDVLQAAILIYRLKNLEEKISKRRANAARYRRELDARFIHMPPCQAREFNIFQNFVIQVDHRDELREYLLDHKIRTAIHYPIPIHLQPAASSIPRNDNSLARVETQAGRILSLPVHPYLGDGQIDHVCHTINQFYRERDRI